MDRDEKRTGQWSAKWLGQWGAKWLRLWGAWLGRRGMRMLGRRGAMGAAMVVWACAMAWGAPYDDNVFIAEKTVDFYVNAKGGKVASVKCVEEQTFATKRTDGRAIAITYYSDKVSIDKASAPCAKPVYVQDDDDEIFFSGTRACALFFDIKKDKTAKAVFERTIKDPTQFCDVYLGSPRYFIRHGVVTIHVPADLALTLKIVPRRLSPSMSFTSSAGAKGGVDYRVEITDLEPFNHEPMAMSWVWCAPRLDIIGQFADETEVYRYLHSHVSDADPGQASVDSLARSLTANSVSDRQRVDTIASWVRQNIRYIAFEHGDYGISPDAASTVLKNRYGDCKGSASLIRSLLRSVGIDGRLAWIGTADENDLGWTERPTLASGNHMIAAAVLPDTILFVDGTAKYSPRGFIPSSIRGQQALVEDTADHCLLVSVPDTPIMLDTDSLNMSVTIDGDLLRAHVVRRFGGVNHHIFCQGYFDSPQDRRERYITNFMSYPFKASTNFENIRLDYVADNAEATTVSADIVRRASVTVAGSTTYVDISPVNDMFIEDVDLKERRRGVRLSTPHRYVTTAEIAVPEGYHSEGLPLERTFDSRWFNGCVSYRLSDDGRTVMCRAWIATTGVKNAELDELKQWNDAVKAYRRANQTRLVFEKD